MTRDPKEPRYFNMAGTEHGPEEPGSYVVLLPEELSRRAQELAIAAINQSEDGPGERVIMLAGIGSLVGAVAILASHTTMSPETLHQMLDMMLRGQREALAAEAN